MGARESEILTFLRAYIDQNGYPPTIREIVDGTSLSSTSTVAYNLDALEQRGLILREQGKARTIRLVELGLDKDTDL